MRYNTVVNLIYVMALQNAEGSFYETKERRQVYANTRSVGSKTFMEARAAGLHADASIQIRSCDYLGEQECEIAGVTYDIERAYQTGDFTVLTLKRRLRSD